MSVSYMYICMYVCSLFACIVRTANKTHTHSVWEGLLEVSTPVLTIICGKVAPLIHIHTHTHQYAHTQTNTHTHSGWGSLLEVFTPVLTIM